MQYSFQHTACSVTLATFHSHSTCLCTLILYFKILNITMKNMSCQVPQKRDNYDHKNSIIDEVFMNSVQCFLTLIRTYRVYNFAWERVRSLLLKNDHKGDECTDGDTWGQKGTCHLSLRMLILIINIIFNM